MHTTLFIEPLAGVRHGGKGVMHKAQKSKTIDFTTMLEALTRPQAFPFALPTSSTTGASPVATTRPVAMTNPIVIQTHASAVILTSDLVYKLKKPQNFGFFDYSTPALRRHFCQQEVRLNAPLAPQIYLGITPVLTSPDRPYHFGPILSPDTAPAPGTTFADGTVIDYAVVMVRLPDTATLKSRVQTGRAELPLLAEIARFVATFHTTTRTDEHIASFGSLDVIRGNWGENFVQMQPYIGRTLDHATYDRIVTYIQHFLAARPSLFASRAREGRIRDCHGDLRMEHVYILKNANDPSDSQTRLAILDRIEFNERFRYSDVVGEIAFLVMELDGASRSDLSRAFVDAYIAATADETLRELLPFYLCYRACVRGKVLSFQLDEPEISATQREFSRQQATELFSLAAHYAHGPTSPVLIMVGGLMGTGKSTIAHALQQDLGWTLLSSDTLRKRLAQLDPAQPQPDAFGQGVYRPEWTAHTYDALRTEASAVLAHGRSVLLDASFIRRIDRQMMESVARAHGATILFVECICPPETTLERLAQRWSARTQTKHLPSNTASDGRPELYDAQRALWEPFMSGEELDVQHIVVTTTQPIAHSREQVLDMLDVPRLICL
jgi:aminoglycoside phosphotransferase family enzyme/predicted kinase